MQPFMPFGPELLKNSPHLYQLLGNQMNLNFDILGILHNRLYNQIFPFLRNCEQKNTEKKKIDTK